MPKIIENIRERILEEAQNQLHTNGYAKTTIRSVASACGIGVGTVYNYFPSKDIMLSAFMLDDWHECIASIEKLDTNDFDNFFIGINQAIGEFVRKYEFLFKDPDAAAPFVSAFSDKHIRLRQQIAGYIAPVFATQAKNFNDETFLSNHVAESMIVWIMSGVDIQDQLTLLRKLCK